MITIATLVTMEASLPARDYMDVERLIMRKAFDLVTPAGDWKGPIDATLGPSVFNVQGMDVHVIARSVAYMTATEATIEETNEGTRIRAKGYRAGPAH